MTDLGYHTTISLLVPTRGRPDQLQAMWSSALGSAVHPELIQLVLWIDQDDPTMVQYMDDDDPIVGTPTNGDVQWLCGPRRMLSECWNECYKVATGGILMHGNDDVLFRTHRWDMEVREAFRAIPDRIACVHGRDGIQDAGLATLGFYSREWVDVLGYFVPPYFSSDYNDLWLSTIADRVGRRVYLPQVYTEHMHPVAGKGPLDQTHLDRLERHGQDNVEQLYIDLAPEREADAQKLRAAIAQAALL